MTFRDLLNQLQNFTDEQLDTPVQIIPTGYCSDMPVDIDGYRPFDGVSLEVSRGEVIFEAGEFNTGCSDVEDWCTPASELADELDEDEQMYSPDDVVLGAGLPYLRIFNIEDEPWEKDGVKKAL